MEIREDFKFNPEGWKKEAVSLIKRSMNVILPIVLIIPLLLSVFSMYTAQYALDVFGIKTGVLMYSVFMVIKFIYILMPFFYLLFFLKRTDFGEKTNITNMIRDINKTKFYFIDYCKILKVPLILIGVFIVVFGSINVLMLLRTTPNELSIILNISILNHLSKIGMLLSMAFFFTINMYLYHYILGIVYLGYGMVNREGAQILTEQAYAKYPEVSDFLLKYIRIANSCFIGLVIIEFMISIVIKDPSLRDIFYILVRFLYIGFCVYASTLIYLISRDLYGGKEIKERVTETDLDKSIIPEIS